MFVGLGLVEQRHKAVLEVLAGATVTDVATAKWRHPSDRPSLAPALCPGGAGRFADHPSRPDRCPHQMPPLVEARILELRGRIPSGGRALSVTSWPGRA